MPADSSVTVVRSDLDQLVALPNGPGSTQRRPWASVLLPVDTTRAVLSTMDERLSDPHDLLLALIRNGMVVQRTDGIRVEILPDAMTSELFLNDLDEASARLTRLLRAGHLDGGWLVEPVPATAAEHAVAAAEQLMRDRVDLVVWSSETDLIGMVERVSDDDTVLRQSWVTDGNDERVFAVLQIAGLPGASARRLRQRAHGSVVAGRTRIDRLMDDGDMLESAPMPAVVDELTRLYADDPETAAWVVVRARDAADAAEATARLGRLPGVSTALHRTLREQDTVPVHLAVGLTSTPTEGVSALLAARETVKDESSVELWLGPESRGMTLSDLLGAA